MGAREAEPEEWLVSGDGGTDCGPRGTDNAKRTRKRQKTTEQGTWGGRNRAPEGLAAWVAFPYPVPQERPGQSHLTQAGLVFAQNVGSQSGKASPTRSVDFK